MMWLNIVKTRMTTIQCIPSPFVGWMLGYHFYTPSQSAGKGPVFVQGNKYLFMPEMACHAITSTYWSEACQLAPAEQSLEVMWYVVHPSIGNLHPCLLLRRTCANSFFSSFIPSVCLLLLLRFVLKHNLLLLFYTWIYPI